MGFRWLGIGIVSGMLVLCAAQAAAQNSTRYISEELEVGVRTGKTLQNRIIRTARGGEQVTVLQQDTDGYSLIRFANGTEGWILTRYLQDQPHSRERLAAAQAELDEIRSGSDDHASRVSQLLEERRALEMERESMAGQIASLESELAELRDVAARPQEIRALNAQLRESLLEAENAADDYRRQVEVMQADNQRKWFLTGSLVTVGSLFLGLLLTRLPRRRRRDEW
jgi:SH3 domain protein